MLTNEDQRKREEEMKVLKSNIDSFIVDKFSEYGVHNIFGDPEKHWSIKNNLTDVNI